MTTFLKIILLLSTPIFVLVGAFIFLMNWNWFLIPLGLPNINIFHAAGLMTTITFLRGYQKVESKENALDQFITLILFNLFALVLGFIFHFFI